MAKTIRGNAHRQPPEPAPDHADVDAWFDTLMPYVQPIVRTVDETLRDVLPDLRYAVKWKRAFYGLAELGWLVELAPYAVSVNVVFFGGADFAPPPALGSGDRSRYVKISTVDEVRRPELREWIAQAGRTAGWT